MFRVMKTLIYIFNKMSSEEGYKALFKGAVALGALYLISMIQVSSLMLPIERSAYENKFKVEVKSGIQVESIDELICDVKNTSTYVDCSMSKYEKNISSSSIDALLKFQKFILYLFSAMMGMSIFGFVIHPTIHEQKKPTEEKKENTPRS